MKKILFIIVAAASIVYGRGTPVKEPSLNTDSARIIDTVPFDTYIAYGDSITADSAYGEGSYVTTISNEFKITSIFNFADGGDTCAVQYGVITNTLSSAINGQTVVTFSCGVNNFAAGDTAADVWVEYKQVIDYILGFDNITLYCIPQYGWGTYVSKQAELEQEIREYSAGRYGVIDVRSFIDDPASSTIKTAYKSVGGTDNHPNQACTDLMAKLVGFGIREGYDFGAVRQSYDGVNVYGTFKANGSPVITEDTITGAQNTYIVSRYLRDEIVNFDDTLSAPDYSIDSVTNILWSGDDNGRALFTSNTVGSVYYSGAGYKAPWGKTVSFAFYLTEAPQYQAFLAGHQTPGTSGEAIVFRLVDSVFTLTINNGSGVYESFNFSAVNVGEWNYVTAKIASDFSTINICLNGVMLSEIVTTVGTPTPTANFSFGFPVGGSAAAAVVGYFDNITWYDRLLSDVEMQRLQAQQAYGFTN